MTVEKLYSLIAKARHSLLKEYRRVYKYESEEFHEDVGFYIDTHTDEYYQWKFVTPDGMTHTWKCLFSDRSIKKEVV